VSAVAVVHRKDAVTAASLLEFNSNTARVLPSATVYTLEGDVAKPKPLLSTNEKVVTRLEDLSSDPKLLPLVKAADLVAKFSLGAAALASAYSSFAVAVTTKSLEKALLEAGLNCALVMPFTLVGLGIPYVALTCGSSLLAALVGVGSAFAGETVPAVVAKGKQYELVAELGALVKGLGGGPTEKAALKSSDLFYVKNAYERIYTKAFGVTPLEAPLAAVAIRSGTLALVANARASAVKEAVLKDVRALIKGDIERAFVFRDATDKFVFTALKRLAQRSDVNYRLALAATNFAMNNNARLNELEPLAKEAKVLSAAGLTALAALRGLTVPKAAGLAELAECCYSASELEEETKNIPKLKRLPKWLRKLVYGGSVPTPVSFPSGLLGGAAVLAVLYGTFVDALVEAIIR